MKKLICILVAAVLMLGLCACNNMMPDTTDIFAGTWIVMPETSAEYAGSTLIMNEDGTATLDVPGKSYTMTWQLHLIPEGVDPYGPDGKYLPKWQGFANNPDAIDFLTVEGPEGSFAYPEQLTFPVLKGTLTVVNGELFLQITDGNAKDDRFEMVLLLTKVTDGTVVEMAEPTTPAATTEAPVETTEAATETTAPAETTEATGETEAPVETTAAATETTAAAN